MQLRMKVVSKTSLELHRELLASGLFTRETQAAIADAVHVNQATISRIAKGQFKKVNKSMLAVCKYADIETIKTSGGKHLRALLESRSDLIDPEKRKLIEIIDLAVDLLERR